MAYGVTSDGFIKKMYSVIIDEKKTQAIAMFGPNVDLTDTSLLYKFIQICAMEEALLWDMGESIYWYWYLDNSPTIGKHNDSKNAFGNIEGLVLDSIGNPINNAEVLFWYDWFNPSYVNSDSNGYFIFNDYARIAEITVSKDGYENRDTTIQILPEDTLIINFSLTTSNSKIEPTILTNFKLFQNYPNPFNPNTTIDYYLPKTANTRINIYDISGKKVTTLINKRQNKGFHSIQFNGSKYASGIYYYQLLTNEFSEVKKMVLMK